MIKKNLINFIIYIKQLAKLSIYISVLFLFFNLIRGVDIFINYGRLIILFGIELFIIFSCNFLLKRMRKKYPNETEI